MVGLVRGVIDVHVVHIPCHDFERSLHVTVSVLLREIILTLVCDEAPLLTNSQMIPMYLVSSFHLLSELDVARALRRDLHAGTTQWHFIFTTVFEMIWVPDVLVSRTCAAHQVRFVVLFLCMWCAWLVMISNVACT